MRAGDLSSLFSLQRSPYRGVALPGLKRLESSQHILKRLLALLLELLNFPLFLDCGLHSRDLLHRLLLLRVDLLNEVHSSGKFLRHVSLHVLASLPDILNPCQQRRKSDLEVFHGQAKLTPL